jgi:hypothetical protein
MGRTLASVRTRGHDRLQPAFFGWARGEDCCDEREEFIAGFNVAVTGDASRSRQPPRGFDSLLHLFSDREICALFENH